MISVRDLSVSFGPKPVVSRVSFAAPGGELTAVIGPNGSGKTTLLRALAGDISFRGEISINGRRMAELRPWRMAAIRAVLPQATALAFPFTVGEIVRLGRTGNGAKDPAIVGEALARVDLAGFAGRFYQELSGGEQQRVQLARVLCQVWTPVEEGEPRWLLLDEPVSSLDIRHQLVIMGIASDYARAGGGVVAVLHDLNLTAMFADQVIVMAGGRLAAAGTPEAVLKDRVLRDVFGCDLRVGVTPPSVPFVLPQSARL
jgi:iron complex transport system ATP-binding protein